MVEITGFGTFRTHVLDPEGILIGTLDGLITASQNIGTAGGPHRVRRCVTVIDLSGDEDPVTYSIRAGSDSIDRSSDGRFLLVSSFRGVAVVDTRSGELSVILDDQTTRAVGVAPIGGP